MFWLPGLLFRRGRFFFLIPVTAVHFATYVVSWPVASCLVYPRTTSTSTKYHILECLKNVHYIILMSAITNTFKYVRAMYVLYFTLITECFYTVIAHTVCVVGWYTC